MIEFLRGKCVARLPGAVVIDVQGVGYGVSLPLRTLCDISPGEREVSLWIYTLVREDSIRLFGFATPEDRQMFELLHSVSGVGPKTALAMLSTHSADAVRRAIIQERREVLEATPGVGARLSELIVVGLRDKMRRMGGPVEAEVALAGAVAPAARDDQGGASPAVLDEVVSALENLGFREKDIRAAMKRVDAAGLDFGGLMRAALSHLS